MAHISTASAIASQLDLGDPPYGDFSSGVAAFTSFMEVIRSSAMERVNNVAPTMESLKTSHESWLVNWLSLINVCWNDPIGSSDRVPKDLGSYFYLVQPDGPKIKRVDENPQYDMAALYHFFSHFNEYVNNPLYDWSEDEYRMGYNRFIYMLYGLLQFSTQRSYGSGPGLGRESKRLALYMAHFLETTCDQAAQGAAKAPRLTTNQTVTSLTIPKGIREGSAFTKHVMEAYQRVDAFMDALVMGQKVAPTQAEFEEFMMGTFVPFAIAYNAAYIFNFDGSLEEDEEEDGNDQDPKILWSVPYSLVETKPHPDWDCDESTYLERKAASETMRATEEAERKNTLKRLRKEMPTDRRSDWQQEIAVSRFIEESKKMELKVNTRFVEMLDRERSAAKELMASVESPRHPEVINSKAAVLLGTPSPRSITLGDGEQSMGSVDDAASAASSTASAVPRKIPNILRRRPTNQNVPGSSLLLFHFGTGKEEIYNRPVITIRTKSGYKPYVVMKVIMELPDLLKKPRNKANFMNVSTNKFFERSVSDMDQRYKNQLYYTMIAFCQDMATTPLMDNETRMEIMARYYGARREDEPLDNYYHNFRRDVWDSIAMYYAFYSYL